MSKSCFSWMTILTPDDNRETLTYQAARIGYILKNLDFMTEKRSQSTSKIEENQCKNIANQLERY